jgi:hypothetical protein
MNTISMIGWHFLAFMSGHWLRSNPKISKQLSRQARLYGLRERTAFLDPGNLGNHCFPPSRNSMKLIYIIIIQTLHIISAKNRGVNALGKKIVSFAKSFPVIWSSGILHPFAQFSQRATNTFNAASRAFVSNPWENSRRRSKMLEEIANIA